MPSLADWLDREDSWLIPGAWRNRDSRGRRHPEPAHAYRSPFQRDRERIVYSSSFRRMTGKTQVLVASVNDHHRTRLTHTLDQDQAAQLLQAAPVVSDTAANLAKLQAAGGMQPGL